MPATDHPQPCSSVQVEVEVTINASPARVWRALVSETPTWWHPEFYTIAEPRKFILEPRLGGRAYEDGGDGTGLTWFTIVGVAPEKSLHLVGHLFPGWGGPAVSMVKIILEPEDAAGSATRVKLRDALIGDVTDKTAGTMREGWTMLLADALKPHVERNGA